MPITEQDALTLHSSIASGALAEDVRKAAAEKLQGYATERQRQGLPLFPSIERQQREERQRFYDTLQDPKKLDEDNGIFAAADSLRPGEGDRLRAKEASALFLSKRYNQPLEVVRKDWDKYAFDYGASKWNEGSLLEPQRFLARAQKEAADEKVSIDTIDDSANAAFRSALLGGDPGKDWQAWQEANPTAPTQSRKAWDKVRLETEKRLGADGRAAAMRTVRALQNATGTAENADGWLNEARRDLVRIRAENPGKYRLVLEAVKAMAEQGPKDDKGVAQGMGESFARSVENITSGSMSALEPFQARLAEAGITNAENPAALAEQIRSGLAVDKDLRDLANGAIDPVTPTGWLDSAAYWSAGSVPYMIAAFNPIGSVSIAGSFTNEAYHDFRRAGWEGTGAEVAALASGGFQAAVEHLSEVMGAIPGVSGIMAKYGVKPGTNWVSKFLVRSGIRAGAEFTEEVIQQATTPFIQELASAISSQVPELPEGQKLKDVMAEFFKADNSVPLLLSVLPLGMIGAGMRTAQDKAIVDWVTSSREMLESVYSPADAAAIAAEPDARKRDALMREKWVNMPTEELVKRAAAQQEKIRKQNADAWRAVTRAEQMGMIPVVRRGQNGWTVTQGGKTLQVESRQEAIEIAYSHLNDLEFQSAAAMAQAADEFMGLGNNPAEAFEISKSERTVQQEVDVGRVTPEQAAENVEVFAQMHGLTAEEAKAERLVLLGNNRSEMVEGVRTAVSRIFGGGNLVTVLHEGVHGRWRQGLESGHYTPEQGLAWVRMAEEATGVDFLATKDDSQVSPMMLDEAITEVTSAAVISKRKDPKQHFTPGLISRGIASFALDQRNSALGSSAEERAKAREAGKFSTFLKGWKEFWGLVLRNARKLKKARAEGKLGADFDVFLDDLLGADAQQRHEGAAAKEAVDMTGEIDNAPFSLASRAVPADTSKVVEMPDGAQLVGPTTFSITAYHGTPHKVDKFTTAKIGTGEGAQAYGWGLYFAASEGVARNYQEQLRPRQPDDYDSAYTEAAKSFISSNGNVALEDLRSAYPKASTAALEWGMREARGQERGNLYTVELLPDADEFLDWDKPLSEQSEKVQKAIRDYLPSSTSALKGRADLGEFEGQRIYTWISNSGDPAERSKALAKAGIPGIRYLDGNSRDGGSGTSNYVIFDENLVKIIEENGRRVDNAPFSLAPRSQQDTEYLAAVEAGDMETAQRMVDEAAKAAGYDVKAHAGHRSGITTYDPSQKTPFFSKSKDVAESYVDEYSSDSDGAEGRGEMDVYNVYLKLGKSLMVDFQGETWQAHPESGDDTDQIAYQAERDGYDSVTFLNIVDDAKSASSRAMPPTDEYAIFKPDAIKSADPITRDASGNVIPLSQRFNPQSDDIRFSLAPRSQQDTDYLAAVEAGDMETAQAMVDEAAKAAGYDTTLMFHGVGETKFNVFKTKSGAHYFTPLKALADGYSEMRGGSGSLGVYLKIKNPFRGFSSHLTESRVNELKAQGYDGATGTIDQSDNLEETVVFSPDQIKSADPVTYDESGNVIPLSQRFNPQSDDIRYSLAPRSLASVADTVLASRMKSPEFRDKFYTIAREKLSAFRRDGDWRVDKFGNASRRTGADSFADRTRTVANIERERKFRQRSRQRELVEQGMNSLTNETRLAYEADLMALEDQPLIASMLNDHGRLMSWKTASEQGRIDAFAGDYDGAPWLPPAWYAKGSGIMPDVMAQYLYDDGHLAEPSTDALWSALQAAIDGVRLQNAEVKKATAAVREIERDALRKSKEEADAWAKVEKDRIPTPKERQMMALRTLDALLSAFPPEIRGRVGGFVQLAALGTDKAREAEIARRLDRLDEVVESEAKKHYQAQISKLFERAKPKRKAGEKPKGKLGPDVHAMLDRVQAAMSMDADEAEGRAETLDNKVASGELSPEEEAIAQREAALTRLFGNWRPRTRPTGRLNVKGNPIVETIDSGADAARMGAAYEALQELLSGAMAESVLAKRAQAEKRQAIREALIASAGNLGDASFRDVKTIETQGFGGWLKEVSIGGLNFEQALEWAFGDSAEVRQLADWERRASNQKEDAIQEAAQAVEDLFTRLAGGRYKGEKLRWQMGQKTLKIGTRTLSQLEALTATMMWMQEDGRRHMEGHLDDSGKPVGKWHYSQVWIDEAESKLSAEAKALRSFLLSRYADGWQGLNAVYSKLNGVNLPQHANYSPLTVQPQQAPAGMGIDPVTGAVTSGKSTSPGGLKSRSGKIAEPSFRDSLQTFMAHTRQMEHWKAYAELVNEARAALANRDVGNAIEGATNAQTRAVLQGWVDFFAEGGTRDAAAYLALVKGIGKAAGRIAAGTLIGRLGVLAVQATQLAAAAAKIPFTSYVKRLAKLMTGNLGWRASMRSAYIQRRLLEMPPIVRQAMEGLSASKPHWIKYNMAKVGRLISGADALFTAGTFAILYDYHIGQAHAMGLRGADAVRYAETEAERATDQVAQPTREGARSLLENRATTPFMRLAWAFASESRKNLGLMVAAAKPGMTKPRFARAVLYATVLNSGIAWLIRSALRDARDPEDDEIFDENHWSASRLALGIGTDWLQGVPVFGQVVQSAVYKVAGEYQPEGNLFSAVSRSLPGWEKLLSGESEDTLKDIDLILSGMAPFNDTISAASSMSHLARDVKDLGANFLSD